MSAQLNEVTLVMVDAIAHDLAHQALRDTLRRIDPFEVLIWSDRRLLMSAKHIASEISSLDDYNRIMWYEVPKYVRTSHFLVMQYDGWVTDEDRWNPEWLTYDYIGAPWWHPRFNVGNGGFSLRSTKLARYLADHDDDLPVESPEDDLLCRRYRGRLEQSKFTWAPQGQAEWFAFERVPVHHSTFGFHGIFNWRRVLSPDALEHRISLANDYVRSRSEWQELQHSMQGA